MSSSVGISTILAAKVNRMDWY